MPLDIEALMSAVVDEMYESFDRLACINAIAALIDVGGELGYQLEPLTVRAAIFNPKLSEQVGDLTDPDAESRLLQLVRQEGTAVVKLGIGEAPAGEWAGHLAAVTNSSDPNKKLVLDPTLPQASQPAHHIVLNPLVLTVATARINEAARIHLRVNGCSVLYSFYPSDRSFEYTPAWGDRLQRIFVRDRVLERIRCAV